jgi:hypothetical protein
MMPFASCSAGFYSTPPFGLLIFSFNIESKFLLPLIKDVGCAENRYALASFRPIEGAVADRQKVSSVSLKGGR